MSLAANIERLTKGRLTAESGGTLIRQPALFAELKAAVKPGNDGTGNGSSGKPIPINADAVDLMAAIKHDAQADHYELRGFRYRGTTSGLLRSYLLPVFVDLTPEWEDYLEHVTLDWADRIDLLIRPRKPRRKLAVDCPRCEQRFHGEERAICITVNCWGEDEAMLPQGKWDVRCDGCGAEWTGHDAVAWFLKSIGQGGVAA